MPVSGEYLLDTNAAIALKKGAPEMVALVAEIRSYVNANVVGELRYGAEDSARKSSNHQRIDELLKTCPALPVTAETAAIYGRLRKLLKDKGRPIPINDVWIAATALEYGMPLITRDQHFDELVELEKVAW